MLINSISVHHHLLSLSGTSVICCPTVVVDLHHQLTEGNRSPLSVTRTVFSQNSLANQRNLFSQRDPLLRRRWRRRPADPWSKQDWLVILPFRNRLWLFFFLEGALWINWLVYTKLSIGGPWEQIRVISYRYSVCHFFFMLFTFLGVRRHQTWYRLILMVTEKPNE